MKKTPKRSYDSECVQECVDQELPRPKDEVIDDFMNCLHDYVGARIRYDRDYRTGQRLGKATEQLRQSLEELIS